MEARSNSRTTYTRRERERESVVSVQKTILVASSYIERTEETFDVVGQELVTSLKLIRVHGN